MLYKHIYNSMLLREYIQHLLLENYNGHLWHISNEKFDKFDSSMGIGSITWFAKDRDDLLKNRHGASINSNKPIWLYKVTASVNNPAGWAEYDKYVLDQLIEMGYDSIDLDDDFVVLNDKNIHIVDVERIK